MGHFQSKVEWDDRIFSRESKHFFTSSVNFLIVCLLLSSVWSSFSVRVAGGVEDLRIVIRSDKAPGDKAKTTDVKDLNKVQTSFEVHTTGRQHMRWNVFPPPPPPSPQTVHKLYTLFQNGRHFSILLSFVYLHISPCFLVWRRIFFWISSLRKRQQGLICK